MRGISDLERGARSAPRLETVRLLADALEVGQASRAALLAAARPDIARRGAADREKPTFLSVPTPLTRLIGREAEVEALCTALRRDDVRFVTLTGAGGSGKTRLAIAVAVEMGDNFSDGVVFVDLSPLTDPALVLPTIATTLGVREVVDQPLSQTLSSFLTSKQLLLVLDNCERVLALPPISPRSSQQVRGWSCSPPVASRCMYGESASFRCGRCLYRWPRQCRRSPRSPLFRRSPSSWSGQRPASPISS